MLDTHRVSLTNLDAMAAGRSDVAVVGQLKQADRSRRLTLLRAVLDSAAELKPAMSPLPPLDEAWTLLIEAQRRDPAATDRVITHPHTGLWAVNVLRRLAKGGPGDPPLWADLGGLHRLASAAAIRAGHDFRSRVPVWRGRVMLPTLGLADVRSRREWDFAQVHAECGNVLVRGPAGSMQLPDDSSADGPGWLALRAVRTGEGELWLDDIDPYREFDGPVPPHRLDVGEVARWADSLRDTWRLLTEHHPAILSELAAGLSTLVPRAAVDRFTPYSASHNEVFGSLVLSRPSDATTFAATLVHEFQHSKLGALLVLVDLLDPAGDNETPRLYAPWRDDPRPPTGLLHGAFSFLGVTAFYHGHYPVETGLAARAAQFEFAYRREQAAHAISTLLADAVPSAVGRRFLTTAREQLREWGTELLPDDIMRAAGRANLDHRLSWRLRHLRAADRVVVELAEAWLRNRPCPLRAAAPPSLTPAVGAAGHARLALTRTWLTDPDLYDIYRAEPDLAMAEIAGMSAADLALVDGDITTAAELYRQQLMTAPDSAVAWAGFALATRHPALLSRPELVHAVHRAVRSRRGVVPNPDRLARWLS
ncbi:HEXXH motif domain-containing protein [Amycolatopsis balhimycina DSM 5908]|uniref:HEXXH motif domain-containing protein n=1 Tax=Amycolatopsis balhimycina DSM 5908 TaxID=1081091 RepID=A0A428W3R3_AMYBA|nr:HEXXH motif domain-containing protein [Amycolatopsis balhimycina]RSM37686.1 HEXXH motif domain-containing protein [Amycolatopsis balhimycina DSM 5908]